MKSYIAAGLSALFLSVPAMAANVTVFTDKDAWAAAVGGSFITEDFSDNSLIAGLNVSGTGPRFSISDNRVNDSLTGPNSTTISYSGKTKGFGGNFDLTPSGPGKGLKLSLSDGSLFNFTLPDEISNTYAGQFFGFVSDQYFSTVKLTAGTQGIFPSESYNFDNIVIATAPVPEPETYALMGIGLIGLFAARRRKVK
ncbi:PEP-CTERM sorting domain-containing protein [Iodobacter violaceini]|uniref:PEP-CTERM sorting domain-containing protein n=1 Tax=Iodobacter violaceini TaxID=3044271 RepID=UPI00197B9203|nr:PEP-CTERM sorting domain-containing protein [Iodobacter violacea]